MGNNPNQMMSAIRANVICEPLCRETLYPLSDGSSRFPRAGSEISPNLVLTRRARFAPTGGGAFRGPTRERGRPGERGILVGEVGQHRVGEDLLHPDVVPARLSSQGRFRLSAHRKLECVDLNRPDAFAATELGGPTGAHRDVSRRV